MNGAVAAGATAAPGSGSGGGGGVAPSTFVAIKSSRDAAAQAPAQAMTKVVQHSTAPTWYV